MGHKECDVIKLGYFDMHEMQSETEKLVKEQQKYEKSLNYDVTDIDNYIKDKFYDTIARKTDKVALRNWQQIQNVKPRNISKHSHFISIKSLTARSIITFSLILDGIFFKNSGSETTRVPIITLSIPILRYFFIFSTSLIPPPICM